MVTPTQIVDHAARIAQHFHVDKMITIRADADGAALAARHRRDVGVARLVAQVAVDTIHEPDLLALWPRGHFREGSVVARIAIIPKQ